MHFHHVLSRVSDLPQFSLSTFKPQLLDRQQNDYISNAKKKIYIEPRNCHISGLVQIKFFCVTKSESGVQQVYTEIKKPYFERNNKFQQTQKKKRCTYFMLDNDLYSKLLNHMTRENR